MATEQDQEVSEAQIAVHWREEEYYYPPAKFIGQANANDPAIFAIGDCASIPLPGRWQPNVPLVLPKAGVFAHAQALALAGRIAAAINGEANAPEFWGHGFCMLEAGEDLAGFAFGDFFATPSPDIHLRNVGKAWHLSKVLFEKWWLTPPGIRKNALAAAMRVGGKAMGVPVDL